LILKKCGDVMTEIEWIVKHREEIEGWYVDLGVFEERPLGPDDDGGAYYESYVANYVAQHAHKFTGQSPIRTWYELGLRDAGLEEIEKSYTLVVEFPDETWKEEFNFESQVKPDLLLEFEEDIWIIEVKFGYYSPDIESSKKTNDVKDCIFQTRKYEARLRHLMELGWFPRKKIHLAIVWGFWWKRKRSAMEYLDTKYSTWLSDRD